MDAITFLLDFSAAKRNRTLINGETYMYTFTQIGSWSYHNHLNARFQGTIVVE